MRFINGGEPTPMVVIEEVAIPRMLKYSLPERGWGLWKAQLLSNDEFLGWILVRPMYFFSPELPTEESNLELGWRFHQSAWGKGYATEAARAVATALRNEKLCDTFTAIAMEDNLASINIMKKLGMRFEKKAIHKDELWQAETVYYGCPCSGLVSR